MFEHPYAHPTLHDGGAHHQAQSEEPNGYHSVRMGKGNGEAAPGLREVVGGAGRWRGGTWHASATVSQLVAGGDFSSALSEAAKAKLAEVRQELREVGEEIELITPHRNVPLWAQQPIRESGAALLIGGDSSVL